MNAAGTRFAARALGRLLAFARRLRDDSRATALVEFAYAVPIFITLGMYGTELAYMATVNMQVSQIAMAVADNASRLGQTDNSSVTPTVTNKDIDSVMYGAMQQGASINFQTNGRVILSSLEKHTTSGRQYIHWQKCRGSLAQNSSYGPAFYGATGTAIAGLGQPSHIVTANTGSAVMFVEAYYSYKGLFGTLFVKNVKFRQESAFIIRDDRSLNPNGPDATGVTGAAGSSEC